MTEKQPAENSYHNIYSDSSSGDDNIDMEMIDEITERQRESIYLPGIEKIKKKDENPIID